MLLDLFMIFFDGRRFLVHAYQCTISLTAAPVKLTTD